MCCGDNKELEPYKYKERYLMALCWVGCGNRHPIHRYRIS